MCVVFVAARLAVPAIYVNLLRLLAEVRACCTAVERCQSTSYNAYLFASPFVATSALPA